MLRVIFLGMDLNILEALRSCPVHLSGVYLPSAPYWILRYLPFIVKHHPRKLRRWLKPVAIYGQLYRYLLNHKIRSLRASDVNGREYLQTVEELNPELGVVANFDQVLGDQLLEIPRHGFVNYHPSLLPRYRGPSPLGRILLNGETYSGATWHMVTNKLDQGDIVAQASFDIEPRDTVKDLFTKSLSLGIKMLQPMIRQIEEHKLNLRPQKEADATYYPKLTPEEKIRLEVMGKLGEP
jgi:methionyl-tRNA formyltransferase